MINEYGPFIKSLRIERGFSQLEIAEKLSMSRPSYIAFEQGKKELSLSEANTVADIFGISLEEMAGGIVPNIEKYKQMILSYLRAGADTRGKVPKTKLAKLLYLADFAWFYKHLESMSGMQYRKIQFGPVPDVYFRTIDEMFENGLINIEPVEGGALFIIEGQGAATYDLSQLNAEEKKLIRDISAKWRNARTNEIVAFTHQQLPYQLCRENEIIPYELITQVEPNAVY